MGSEHLIVYRCSNAMKVFFILISARSRSDGCLWHDKCHLHIKPFSWYALLWLQCSSNLSLFRKLRILSDFYSRAKRGGLPGGGGGTPLYGLYRYVPRNRVWFLEVLDP